MSLNFGKAQSGLKLGSCSFHQGQARGSKQAIFASLGSIHESSGLARAKKMGSFYL